VVKMRERVRRFDRRTVAVPFPEESGLDLAVLDDDTGSASMSGGLLVTAGMGASTENKSSIVGKSTEPSLSKSGSEVVFLPLFAGRGLGLG
jgi:hypothetical protein